MTLDLPTPPLPDEISSGRVREPGWANGIARPSAWPCGWPCTCPPPSPCRRRRSASRSSSVITVKSTLTAVTPSSGATALSTRLRISLQRAAGDGEGDEDGHAAVVGGSTSRTMPRSTIERCSSGSSTGRRASMIWSWLTGVTGMGFPSGICTTAIGRIPAWPAPTADAQGPAFTAAVSAITDAFGDPTRRRIYLFARDHGGADGVTAAAVAAEVGVHPNVARHHLDKLAAGGYVEVVVALRDRRAPGRAAVEALRRRGHDGVRRRRPGAQRRPRPGPARPGARPAAATRGRGDGRGGRGDVRPGDGRRAHRRRARHRAALAALGDAGRRRRAHRPRLRRPHGLRRGRRAARNRPAHHQRPLPVRHRRHRPPGDLRRRPRHGARDAQRALRAGDDVEVATEASKARGDTFCATAV